MSSTTITRVAQDRICQKNQPDLVNILATAQLPKILGSVGLARLISWGFLHSLACHAPQGNWTNDRFYQLLLLSAGSLGILIISKWLSEEYRGVCFPVLAQQSASWRAWKTGVDQPASNVQNETPDRPYQQISFPAAPSDLHSWANSQIPWQSPYSSYDDEAFWVVYLLIDVLVRTRLTFISNRLTIRPCTSQDSLDTTRLNILLDRTSAHSVDLLRFKP